jgi:hypothetical protein
VLVSKRQVGPNIGSDHYPLVVDFSIRSENTPARISQQFLDDGIFSN